MATTTVGEREWGVRGCCKKYIEIFMIKFWSCKIDEAIHQRESDTHETYASDYELLHQFARNPTKSHTQILPRKYIPIAPYENIIKIIKIN